MSANNNIDLIAAHAEYVKGAVEETIGNWTGSESWKESGHKDKDHALASMRSASNEPSVEDRN
eukprot:c33601_g1_i1 orf=2-187(-)